jgi:hypothetical protein
MRNKNELCDILDIFLITSTMLHIAMLLRNIQDQIQQRFVFPGLQLRFHTAILKINYIILNFSMRVATSPPYFHRLSVSFFLHLVCRPGVLYLSQHL